MEGGHPKADLSPLLNQTDYAPRDYWKRLKETAGGDELDGIGRVVLAVSVRPGMEHVIFNGYPYDGEKRYSGPRSCAFLTDWNSAQMKAARPERLSGMEQRGALKCARNAYLATGALNNSQALTEYFLRLIPAMVGRPQISNTAREKIVNYLVDVTAERRPSLYDIWPNAGEPTNRLRRDLTYLDQLGGLIQETGMGLIDQEMPEWRDRTIGRTLLDIAFNLNNPLCSYELRANGLVTPEVRRRDFDIQFFLLYADAKEGRLKDKSDAQQRAFASLQERYSDCFLRWGTERQDNWGDYDIGIGLEWMQALGYRHHIYCRGDFAREYVMLGTPRIERPNDGLSGKGTALKQASDLVVRIDRYPHFIQSKVSGGSKQYAIPIIVTRLGSNSKPAIENEADKENSQNVALSKENAAKRFPEIARQYRDFYRRELEVLDPYSPTTDNDIVPQAIDELLASEILEAA